MPHLVAILKITEYKKKKITPTGQILFTWKSIPNFYWFHEKQELSHSQNLLFIFNKNKMDIIHLTPPPYMWGTCVFKTTYSKT